MYEAYRHYWERLELTGSHTSRSIGDQTVWPGRRWTVLRTSGSLLSGLSPWNRWQPAHFWRNQHYYSWLDGRIYILIHLQYLQWRTGTVVFLSCNVCQPVQQALDQQYYFCLAQVGQLTLLRMGCPSPLTLFAVCSPSQWKMYGYLWSARDVWWWWLHLSHRTWPHTLQLGGWHRVKPPSIVCVVWEQLQAQISLTRP